MIMQNIEFKKQATIHIHQLLHPSVVFYHLSSVICLLTDDKRGAKDAAA
jgi:hypothetical protein